MLIVNFNLICESYILIIINIEIIPIIILYFVCIYNDIYCSF